MEEIDVPPYFLCPISLQIMGDPVTVSTGITYDRESIEKWLFSNRNNTCPVTKQLLLSDTHLTPNHTLRRLIQSWCTVNSSHGIERIPTPKPLITKTRIAKLLTAAKSPISRLKSLKTLRSIASENETNKRLIESAGAVAILASVLSDSISIGSDEELGFDLTRSSEEAFSILYALKISETGLKAPLGNNGEFEFLDLLTKIMRCGSYESRAYAVMLLNSIFEVADPNKLTNLKIELFEETVRVLFDEISQQASKAAIQILISLCPWGRNRVKAVQANGVWVVIEILLNSSEKRLSEMALVALDLMCGCAEGRAEVLKHGGGLAVVSKKILRVSQVGSERAVRILYSISKFSASPSVVQEMVKFGVVEKLWLLLHVECGSRVSERAREILRLHGRTWRKSPCISNKLLSSYPS